MFCASGDVLWHCPILNPAVRSVVKLIEDCPNLAISTDAAGVRWVFSASPSAVTFFVRSIAQPAPFLHCGWQNCQEFASTSVIITWLWWSQNLAAKESIPRTED